MKMSHDLVKLYFCSKCPETQAMFRSYQLTQNKTQNNVMAAHFRSFGSFFDSQYDGAVCAYTHISKPIKFQCLIYPIVMNIRSEKV